MSAFAVVENGVVVNLAEADEAFGQDQGWIPAGSAAIGDQWDGQQFIASNAPAPIPEIISPSQLLRSLNHFSMRTMVDNYVAGEDQDTKDWYARATQFERHHPRVVSAIASLSITDAQADEVWVYGSSL